MQFAAAKILPSFFVAVIAVVAVWVVMTMKFSAVKKAAIVGALAAVELYTIDAVFVQNVERKE